jgi:class 3 adenylate cyclase/predicted ATPase
VSRSDRPRTPTPPATEATDRPAASPSPSPGGGPAASSDAPGLGVERKRTTILFVDLVGFNAISERAGTEPAWGVLTRCLALVDGVARRHGAAVDKFLGDAMMAVFGHPIAVDDPDRRALRAALEMRRVVADLRADLAGQLPGFDGEPPLDVQMGVNTGEVVFGDLGDVRREFSILGDPVNVAARLKSKAGPGGIYVGPETRAGAGDAFVFADLEPLTLKGKAKPVPASELVETRDDPTALGGDAVEVTGFVGRDAERARLRDAAVAVSGGRGGVRAVVGEAGTGKSRLVVEAARAAADLPLAWRMARARPGDAPLAPFAPLVRHFAGLEEHEPGSVVRRRLREALGEPTVEHDATLACLLRILGRSTRGGEGRSLEGLSPEAHRAVMVDSVVTVIEALAERQPLLLVLEDWQWAEPASRQAVRALSGVAARRPLGVWVVGRSLDDLVPASVETVRLDALAPDEAETLVGALAEACALPDDVRALVLERGRGNPMETVLSAYLAPALQADARRAREDRHRERETERRRTTVMFADLSGFTSLSERAPIGEVYAAVTACLDRLHRVALKHGGSVDKHMGDCVMAVFGFPEAMEDAPRAAVNAAIEMLREVETFNAERELPSALEVHVGIETGPLIAGSLSGSVIGEFAVMGDAAKAADRLTDLAESGQIFVGDQTRRATDGAFAYEAREPFRLTARSAELASFELLSRRERLDRAAAKPALGSTSALVGREDELRRVATALGALSDGQGGVVSVLGEAGIGKSRLLEEIRAGVDEARIGWLESRSLSIGRSLPFHTFADLVASWAGRHDDEAAMAEAWWTALRSLLGDRADDVAPYLLTVANLPVPERHRARLDALAGDAMEKLVLRAFTEWLRALARERPRVLVFDDLYWADLSSIELLESLLRLTDEHPILFVTLSRVHYAETSDRILEVVRERYPRHHVELHLQPLGAEACRELIRNLFRGADVPARLRATLEEKAAGNPLFVEEVVRSLLADGALVVEAGALRATERIADAEVPGSIQEVVLARIDLLAPAPRALLQVASALGRAFEEDVLAEVLERDDVTASLDALVAEEMLTASSRAGRRYEFKHPLIQETAYDSILQARREALHRRIGEVIEARLSPEVPGYEAMLAYHFGRGRDAERAEHHLFRAGDEAARASASNEALRFFEEASRLYLELHGETGDRRKMATLEGHIARAYSNRGQLLEAVLHYNDALRHLGERVPGDREILLRVGPLLLGVLARLYWPGNARRPADARRREVIELMYGRAKAQPTTAPVRFVFDTMHNLWKLQQVDPRTIPNAGAMYASTVGTFAFGGVSFAVSRRFLEEAEPLVQPDDRREGLIFGFMRFLHHFLEGDWSDERGLPRERVDEAIEIGALWEVANFLDLDSERCIAQGRLERAREQLDVLARVADLFQYDLARASHQGLTALLQIEEGRFDEAIRSCERYFEEHEEDSFRVMALASRAKAEALAGRCDDADATLARAAGVIERSGSLLPFHQSAYQRSRALTDVLRLERAGGAADRALRRRAGKSLARALRLAENVAARRPEVLRLAARYRWRTGSRRRAHRLWERAFDESARLGARPERARTELDLAACLAERPGERGPDGRAPAELVESAEATLAELGLGAERERARTLREALA